MPRRTRTAPARGTRPRTGAHFLVAKRGDDVAFVSDDGGWWNEYGSWVKQSQPTTLAWYVIDDRKMYKPSEEVHLKGWLRGLVLGLFRSKLEAGFAGMTDAVKARAEMLWKQRQSTRAA